MAKTQGVTDREKLETTSRATIEWNFGQICDYIDDQFPSECKKHGVVFCADCFKAFVRKHGNESIRVIGNHLEHYNIVRNHRNDPVNLKRVAAQAAGENHGR